MKTTEVLDSKGRADGTSFILKTDKLNENVFPQISHATTTPNDMCFLCVHMHVSLDGAAASPVLDFAAVRNKRVLCY